MHAHGCYAYDSVVQMREIFVGHLIGPLCFCVHLGKSPRVVGVGVSSADELITKACFVRHERDGAKKFEIRKNKKQHYGSMESFRNEC